MLRLLPATGSTAHDACGRVVADILVTLLFITGFRALIARVATRTARRSRVRRRGGPSTPPRALVGPFGVFLVRRGHVGLVVVMLPLPAARVGMGIILLALPVLVGLSILLLILLLLLVVVFLLEIMRVIVVLVRLVLGIVEHGFVAVLAGVVLVVLIAAASASTLLLPSVALLLVLLLRAIERLIVVVELVVAGAFPAHKTCGLLRGPTLGLVAQGHRRRRRPTLPSPARRPRGNRRGTVTPPPRGVSLSTVLACVPVRSTARCAVGGRRT